MNDLKYSIITSSLQNFKGDIIIFLVSQGKNKKCDCTHISIKNINKILKNFLFTGKKGEELLIVPNLTKGFSDLKAQKVCFLGCGEATENVEKENDMLRKIGGQLSKFIKKNDGKNVVVVPPHNNSLDLQIKYITEGILLGTYEFSKYQKEEEDSEEKTSLITQTKTFFTSIL